MNYSTSASTFLVFVGKVAMMAALGAVAQHYIKFPGFAPWWFDYVWVNSDISMWKRRHKVVVISFDGISYLTSAYCRFFVLERKWGFDDGYEHNATPLASVEMASHGRSSSVPVTNPFRSARAQREAELMVLTLAWKGIGCTQYSMSY